MHWKRKEKILSIARETRKHVKSFIGRNEDIYFDVNTKTLECGCGIASSILLKRLHASGYDSANIFDTDSHAFIIVEGYLLDITATQFKGFERKAVLFELYDDFLKSGRSPNIQQIWGDGKSSKSTSHFIMKQKADAWPEEQIIRSEHLETA